jgi:hypothetical protein
MMTREGPIAPAGAGRAIEAPTEHDIHYVYITFPTPANPRWSERRSI